MLFKTPGGSEVIYSTDGITGSARNMCETEILSQLLEEVIASVQRFFSPLPADQSGETLQKRKHLIMLSEMTQLQNHGADRSSHLVYAGGGHVSEEQGCRPNTDNQGQDQNSGLLTSRQVFLISHFLTEEKTSQPCVEWGG